MLVKEVIAKLSKLDGMSEVVFQDPNNLYKFPVNSIYSNEQLELVELKATE